MKFKQALILGYGLTGKSFADYCKINAIEYFIFSDKKEEIENSEERNRFFCDSDESWKNISVVFISPSIKMIFNQHFIVKKAKEKKIKIMSDFDLFYLELLKRKVKNKPKIISITGTNGKSTTTSLIYFILKKLKFKAKLVGNIGLPILYELKNKNLADYYILESSSYQVENSNKIKYDFGIFLNIFHDHIDHHGSFDNYLNSKIKMLTLSKKISTTNGIMEYILDSKICNLNYKKTLIRKRVNIISTTEICKKINEKNLNYIFSYSFDKKTQNSTINISNGKQVIKFSEIFSNLKGFYNVENILFAISSLECIFGRKTFSFIKNNLLKIIKIIKSFKNLEHRNESFLKIKNHNNIIEFINDSKATNLNATELTLSCFSDKKICLIMGGISKELTIKDINLNLLKNVYGVFLIGQASDLFYNEFIAINKNLKNLVEVKKSQILKQAIIDSFEFAKKNNCDTIILSPMCASFDQFKNYEERGRIFKDICNDLIEKK